MLGWLKGVFSSESSASFGRVASLFTVATGCWSVIHIVLTTHALPDGTALAGLGLWMVSPYAINKAAGALQPNPSQPSDQPPDQDPTHVNLQASAASPWRRLDDSRLTQALVKILLLLAIWKLLFK